MIPRRRQRWWLFVGVGLLFFSCFLSLELFSGHGHDQWYDKIKPGVDAAEVEDILGTPSVKSGDFWTWYGGEGQVGAITIEFDDNGKVILVFSTLRDVSTFDKIGEWVAGLWKN